ncbi:MAG: hypothetical protein E3J23_08705 [Candidatus Stahlbacteria bacterium]|nr:MAG: hypothetical protein E3J23_08705 [Candidatus Stahlbacteria bacterium]
MWPMIILGAIQAGASIFQGIAQSQAGEQNARVLEQQAQLRREEGELVRRSLFERARRTRVQGEAFVGSQRAGVASAGVSLEQGSPLAVLAQTRKSIATDVARTREAGQRAFALGLSQADILGQQADITRQFGTQQAIAGGIQGGTSFLGTLNQANIYQNFWQG